MHNYDGYADRLTKSSNADLLKVVSGIPVWKQKIFKYFLLDKSEINITKINEMEFWTFFGLVL